MTQSAADDHARQILDWLRKADCAVALTGAGVSTASGIPDFRGPAGLYSKISQRTFERDFLFDHPAEYYRIAVEHIHPLADKTPNDTHRLLAELERQNLLAAVITQNIDRLHHKAGSENVVEFHGDCASFYCSECQKPWDRAAVEAKIAAETVPYCDCKGLIRPGIVFFGDTIPMHALMESQMLASQCDVFLALGSSLEVNPAAGLTHIAKQSGAKVVIANLGPTRLDPIADLRCEIDLSTLSRSLLNLLNS
jgi:NAD-dependent deacetylase